MTGTATNMHNDQTGKTVREFSTRLLGSDIQFRDGSTTRLGAHLTARKLFRENRTGAIVDLAEMLSRYYREANTTPEIMAAAAAAAQGRGELVDGTQDLAVSCAFPAGAFGFRANEGMKDIDRIDFDVEVTVRPAKGT